MLRDLPPCQSAAEAELAWWLEETQGSDWQGGWMVGAPCAMFDAFCCSRVREERRYEQMSKSLNKERIYCGDPGNAPR